MITTHHNGRIADVLFFYSLFVQFMYINANKVTFIVIDIINPIIRISKKSTINTTSLSHSKTMKLSGNTNLLISFPMLLTI